MKRRTVLSGLATVVVSGLTGCLTGALPGGSEQSPAEADSATASATLPPEGDVGLTFESTFGPTDRCPAPGDATVSVRDRTVQTRGCIRGANGCTDSTLEAIFYDAPADRLKIVVATVTERERTEACTDAIVARGYEVTVAFDDRAPETVAVVHDGVDGRHAVARHDVEG